MHPRLALVLALTGAAAACAQDPPRPQVEVPARQRLGGGSSVAFLGQGQDGEGFFKREGGHAGGRTGYGNFEAELLVSRLFERLGIQTPRTRTVEVVPRHLLDRLHTRVHLQAEVVDARFTGGQAPRLYAEGGGPLIQDLDLRGATRLMLADILVGNADRHGKNLMLYRDAQGITRLVAIDHDMAMTNRRVLPRGYHHLNFQPGFDGVEVDVAPRANEGIEAERAGTLRKLTSQNALYEWLTEAARRDPGMAGLIFHELGRMQAALPDAYLEALVEALPERDFVKGDPAARRAELVRILEARRDGMAAAWAQFLGAGPPAPGVEVGATLGRNLPGDLGARLRAAVPGEAGRVLLILSLDPVYGQMAPAELYVTLRAEGVEPGLAREVLEARGEGLEAGALREAEARALRALEQKASRRAAGPDATLGARRMAEGVRTGETWRWQAVTGDELPAARRGALEVLVRQLEASGQLEGASRVLVAPDPLAGEGRWRVEVQGREGWRFFEVDAPAATSAGGGAPLAGLRPAEVHALRGRLVERALALSEGGGFVEAEALFQLAEKLDPRRPPAEALEAVAREMKLSPARRARLGELFEVERRRAPRPRAPRPRGRS